MCCFSQGPTYHLSTSLPPTLPTTLRERHRFLLRICCSPCSWLEVTISWVKSLRLLYKQETEKVCPNSNKWGKLTLCEARGVSTCYLSTLPTRSDSNILFAPKGFPSGLWSPAQNHALDLVFYRRWAAHSFPNTESATLSSASDFSLPASPFSQHRSWQACFLSLTWRDFFFL